MQQKRGVFQIGEGVSFRIDQHQPEGVGRVGQQETGDSGAYPFTLAAAGGSSNQDMSVFRIGQIRHSQCVGQIDP